MNCIHHRERSAKRRRPSATLLACDWHEMDAAEHSPGNDSAAARCTRHDESERHVHPQPKSAGEPADRRGSWPGSGPGPARTPASTASRTRRSSGASCNDVYDATRSCGSRSAARARPVPHLTRKPIPILRNRSPKLLRGQQNEVGDKFTGVIAQMSFATVRLLPQAHPLAAKSSRPRQRQVQGRGALGIQLTSIGHDRVGSTEYEVAAKGKGKRTAGFIGGGAGPALHRRTGWRRQGRTDRRSGLRRRRHSGSALQATTMSSSPRKPSSNFSSPPGQALTHNPARDTHRHPVDFCTHRIGLPTRLA